MKLLSGLSKKSIRMILGIMMMTTFVDLALTLYFLFVVSVKLGSLSTGVLVFFSMNYLWIPQVSLIIVCYLLLTRVWRFDS
jgi:hypothetical protein